MTTFLLSVPWLLLILTTSGAVPPLPHTLDYSYTFEEFIKDFSKTYEDEERDHRKAIFESNLHHILEHNKKVNHGHVSGVNHFMDLESHELPMGYDKSFHEAWQGNGVSEVLKNHQVSYLQCLSINSEKPAQMILHVSIRWIFHLILTMSPHCPSLLTGELMEW